MDSPITIGVSACLLGELVRYDGGHKHDRCVTDTLGSIFRLVGVCPEVECGLPTPREVMRLEGDPASPRLMTIRTRRDLTDQMLTFCERRVRELEQADLCGFIFKKNSPSSGLSGVPVYDCDGLQTGTASGLFAAAVVRHFPRLPVEEAERLHDPVIREQFIAHVVAYRHHKDLPEAHRHGTISLPPANASATLASRNNS